MPVASQHGTLFLGRHKPGKGTGRKAFHMLLAIINFIQAWKRYNTSLNELYQLGDRELADIGITRSDIPRIAWDSASVKR
jgi:uncharacterized protein YjiS (DUF1127 family)